jgi:hypothetical protein
MADVTKEGSPHPLSVAKSRMIGGMSARGHKDDVTVALVNVGC